MFRYYIMTIIFCISAIAAANELFVSPDVGLPPFFALMLTLLAVLEAFAVDALAAIAVRYFVPERYYDPLRRRFACARFEKKLYIKLGIRTWKDKIPETGGLLVGFPKDRVADLRDSAYLYKFMQETCYAEVMHLWSMPFGFTVLLLCPASLRLTVALPVALVNLVLQLLPILVQRFIRPQLLRVYNNNLKRQKIN